MKKLIVILATLLVANTASAGHFGHHHGHHGPVIVQNNDWVGPAILTGVVGYAIGRSTAPQTQPVIVQQAPQTYPGPVPYPSQYPGTWVERQNCGPWTEVQNPDGTSTRTRACN